MLRFVQPAFPCLWLKSYICIKILKRKRERGRERGGSTFLTLHIFFPYIGEQNYEDGNKVDLSFYALQVKCYTITNSNFSFVILGNLTGAKKLSGYK